MGVIDWINNSECIISEEKDDWIKMKKRLEENIEIILMPSVICDAWPIYVLCDLLYGEKVMNVAPTVFVVPLGGHEFWIKRELECLLNRFYKDDEISVSPNYYDVSLQEVILLDCCNGSNYLCVNGLQVNGFMAELRTKTGKTVYILAVMEKAEIVWNEYIVKYKIPVVCIVDSHKGLGDWFTSVPLYKAISESKDVDILPKYYFKGKYISTSAPENFEWIIDIKESSERGCISQIYRANWEMIEEVE